MYTLAILGRNNEVIRCSPEYVRNVSLHFNFLLAIWDRIWDARRIILASDVASSLQIALIRVLGASLELYQTLPYVHHGAL